MKDIKTGLCITCKYFLLQDHGREFENIIDTEYMQFKCSIYGETTEKEYYLMQPPKEIETIETVPETKICEFWEEWIVL